MFYTFFSFAGWLQTEPCWRHGCSWRACSFGVPTTSWTPWAHHILEERWRQLGWQRWTHHSNRHYFSCKHGMILWIRQLLVALITYEMNYLPIFQSCDVALNFRNRRSNFLIISHFMSGWSVSALVYIHYALAY